MPVRMMATKPAPTVECSGATRSSSRTARPAASSSTAAWIVRRHIARVTSMRKQRAADIKDQSCSQPSRAGLRREVSHVHSLRGRACRTTSDVSTAFTGADMQHDIRHAHSLHGRTCNNQMTIAQAHCRRICWRAAFVNELSRTSVLMGYSNSQRSEGECHRRPVCMHSVAPTTLPGSKE